MKQKLTHHNLTKQTKGKIPREGTINRAPLILTLRDLLKTLK